MKENDEGILLRIFVSESDKYQGLPLYEGIVLKAKELGISGATVTRGIMGFGADSRMHSAKVLRLAENLPIIIEMVDRQESIDQLIPFLDSAVREGLITQEKVKVIKYRNR